MANYPRTREPPTHPLHSAMYQALTRLNYLYTKVFAKGILVGVAVLFCKQKCLAKFMLLSRGEKNCIYVAVQFLQQSCQGFSLLVRFPNPLAFQVRRGPCLLPPRLYFSRWSPFVARITGTLTSQPNIFLFSFSFLVSEFMSISYWWCQSQELTIFARLTKCGLTFFWSLCKNPIRWQSNLWLKSIQVLSLRLCFVPKTTRVCALTVDQVERMFSIPLRDTAGAGFSIKVKLILGFTLFPTIGFLRGRCLALKGVGGPTIGLCARPCIMAF